MSDQFNPTVPPIALGNQGTVLGMQQGSPVFTGAVTTLYTASTPVGIPSSGSIGNNGALTGLTAFGTTYPAIWLFFPVNAIFAGSAAGFYFCQMSSTTAGTIFNNTLPVGTRPVIPVSPVPFVTTGPGAYTQSTTVQILAQPTLAAGSLQKDGACQIYSLGSTNATLNNKTINTLLGGTSLGSFTSAGAGSFQNLFQVYNQGQINRQVFLPTGAIAGYGPITSALTHSTVNTGNPYTVEVDGTLATATDYIVLEALSVFAGVYT